MGILEQFAVLPWMLGQPPPLLRLGQHRLQDSQVKVDRARCLSFILAGFLELLEMQGKAFSQPADLLSLKAVQLLAYLEREVPYVRRKTRLLAEPSRPY